MNESKLIKIKELLEFIYGSNQGAATYDALLRLLPEDLALRSGADEVDGRGLGRNGLSEKDACLITYGDILRPSKSGMTESEAQPGTQTAPQDTALARLGAFLKRWNRGSFSYLHILPFHPYSSDDGFSVIDYRKIDPNLGSWEDIGDLAKNQKLVFDLVLNHGSVKSEWFQGFLAGDPARRGWYITRPSNFDTSMVFRPRTHPLLTEFTRNDGGCINVWTTFSADQVDYNFANPEVLLEFIRIFFEYVRHGARILRLDAIAYLWKEDGTSCLHHPKTHAVVKLLRALIDCFELDLLILTETNVPHRENISYYGDGDEAHLVYNFALPPLVLHAAVSEDATPLRDWARKLPKPGEGPIFFNFLASHDGVGLLPARGLINETQFQETIDTVLRRGSLLSYKGSQNGQIPYEINCSYLSAVAPASVGDTKMRARIFLACHGALFALAGLPAVFFHSWIGSEQWPEGPALLGYNRAINREKLAIDRIERELGASDGLRAAIYAGFSKMLAFRATEPAFSPQAPQAILSVDRGIFAVVRGPDRTGRRVLCAQNFGSEEVTLEFEGALLVLGARETRWIAYGGDRKISELRI